MSTTQKVIRAIALVALIAGVGGVIAADINTLMVMLSHTDDYTLMYSLISQNTWIAIEWGILGIIGGSTLALQVKAMRMSDPVTPALIFKLMHEDILTPDNSDRIVEMNRQVMLPVSSGVSFPGQEALF